MSGESVAVMEHGAQGLMVRETGGGVMALATMNEKEFEARLAAMKTGQDRMRKIQKTLMIGPTTENPEGEDYGIIPGTKKPTLYKPGAEKLCAVYGLVATFEETWIEGDGITGPNLRVRMKCLLHVGSAEGPVVGEGVGAANSWERKHRWRVGQRACPTCGAEGSILRSKKEDDNGDRGWFCWAKKGGCGAQFFSTAPGIVEQQAGEIENKDPFDVENTLLKMAKKRAHVDGALTTTATSGLFAQDVEDLPHGGDNDERKAPAAKASAPAAREPGDDETDDERLAREAYERAGVEPPEVTAARPVKTSAQPTPKFMPACPVCKHNRAVIKSKFGPEGEFVCWEKATRAKGCGRKFQPGGPADEPGAAEGAEALR